MKTMLLVAMVVVSGCGSSSSPTTTRPTGPSAQDQETALEIVWEGVYGMDTPSRPRIAWFFDCIPDRLHVVVTPECWTEQATPSSGVELEWLGSISSSDFSKGLDSWRGYVLTGRFSEWDLSLVGKAQQQLVAAGL